jgi:hypothetical protein
VVALKHRDRALVDVDTGEERGRNPSTGVWRLAERILAR